MASRVKINNIKELEKRKNSTHPSLVNIRKILLLLKNPQKNLGITIGITGTNGKGSVAKTLSTILNDSNLKTGLYTSPHLYSINERISIGKKNISTKELNQILTEIFETEIKANIKLSFFELITVVAIIFLSKKKNIFNIFEVGLGGRFDATNVIDSEISIITNIGKDHKEYLGNTLLKIAKEKIGIIKKDSFFITGMKPYPFYRVKNYILKKTKKIYVFKKDFQIENNKEFYKYENLTFKPSLKGSHQIENMALVLKTCSIIKNNLGFDLKNQNIINSLESVKWEGRFSILSSTPYKIVDVAHNYEAIKVLVQNVKKITSKKFIVILGMLNDKDPIKCINELLNIANKIILFKVNNQRTFIPEKIAKKINNKKVVLGKSEELGALIEKDKNILYCGSIYFIGDLLKKYKNLRSC